MAVRSDQKDSQAVILADISAETGYDFESIASIDTRVKGIAQLVLPVLVRWPQKVQEPNIRCAIYAKFHTPYARKFFDQVVSWWLAEDDELALSLLTAIITLLLKTTDAERIWTVYRDQPVKPFHYMLLSKLAQLSSRVSSEVRDVLAYDLEHKQLTVGDLQFISKLDDVRITAWFERQVSSPNALIRRIALQRSGKRKRVPDAITQVAKPPDRTYELFSTEVDLDKLPEILDQIEKEMGFTVPDVIRTSAFLDNMKIGKWGVTTVQKGEERFTLWFRLEDVDVVEIVVATDRALR